MARGTAQSLKSRGASSLFVAHRSFDKAAQLSASVGGEVLRFSEWLPYLEQIDIVLVSTASPAYVVTPQTLESVLPARGGRTLFIMDLSVPRNVDPACAQMPGVHVDDMDALESMAAETRRARSQEIARCAPLIQEWMQENAPALLFPPPPPPRRRGSTPSPAR